MKVRQHLGAVRRDSDVPVWYQYTLPSQGPQAMLAAVQVAVAVGRDHPGVHEAQAAEQDR